MNDSILAADLPNVLGRLFMAAVLICGSEACATAAEYLGPDAVVAAKDGRLLYVACRDARQIAVVEVASRRTIARIDLPATPTGMALDPDGTMLYVACSMPRDVVCVLETASNTIVDTMASGSTPVSPVVTPDGKRLYVCNRFDSAVTAIDLPSGEQIAVVPALREPCSAAATPDGRAVFVANLLPLDRGDAENVAAAITAIDTATNQTTAIRLPAGSTVVRGLCVSPDGSYVYAVHILARYRLPATRSDRGWINTSALSVIDARAKKLINTVALSGVDLGAADPWAVAITGDGKRICVTHAGTHELSVIDATGLMEKLGKFGGCLAGATNRGADAGESAISSAADVPNDLAFLADLRRRVALGGNGPHGVAVIGSNAYVAEYFSDTIDVVDLRSDSPQILGRVVLGPTPKPSAPRRGEMLFNDATVSFQHWQSCASCHPDARMDGLNWDLLNDGIGNPKNTRSLINVHQSSAVMSLAARDSAKAAIRAGIRRILFAERPEEDVEAIDEYLGTLTPVPSPRLIGGRPSPAADRGKKIFFDPKIGCAKCHPGPFYTDRKAHDVGSAGPLDKPGDKFQTPRLVEVWRTAPYLHDGRYRTVKELLVEGKHGAADGDLGSLSEKDLDDLAEFLLSL